MSNLSKELIESYESEGYENRELSQREINHMANDHGFRTKTENNTLYVLEQCYDKNNVDISAWITTTNWSLFDMLNFLNY